MKKIYNGHVIKYDLKGNQIKIFSNAAEAAKETSNYSSIIN
jgi:hypothetical protein